MLSMWMWLAGACTGVWKKTWLTSILESAALNHSIKLAPEGHVICSHIIPCLSSGQFPWIVFIWCDPYLLSYFLCKRSITLLSCCNVVTLYMSRGAWVASCLWINLHVYIGAPPARRPLLGTTTEGDVSTSDLQIPWWWLEVCSF